MVTPHEIIARDFENYPVVGPYLGIVDGVELAERAIEALTASGYHILSDADLAKRNDEVLVRAELACFHQQSKIHDRKRTEWDRGNDSAVNGCIAAIRALKGGKQ